MVDEVTAKTGFEPIHKAHALEQVTLAVQFERGVAERTFSQISKAAEAFLPDLPEKQQLQGLSLSIGGGAGVAAVGLVLRKKHEDESPGFANDLIIEPSSIAFRTTRYTRWNEVWGQASKYFAALVPLYKTNISSVQLNFVDKFRWHGEISECRPNLVLRDNSKYLAPHIFEMKDLWHSHTGAFIRVNGNVKRLLNINVDHNDEKSPSGTAQRQIVISTVLNDMLNQDGYDILEVSEQSAMAFISDRMTDMHETGKTVFGQVITDHMARRIALKE